MAKEKVPEIDFEDVPSWLMTFSDVITLLMTFFILLLTFATSEPEKFEQMQVSLFGGGGAMGIAGDVQKPLDKDAVLMRKRPDSGRITTRGSEMPPVNADPTLEGLAKGIAGLESSEQRELSTQHALTVPVSLMVDEKGRPTPLGVQQLRMLARHMRKQPIDVQFLVSNPDDVQRTLGLASYLFEHEGILPGRLAVGQDASLPSAPVVEIVLTRPLVGETADGS